MEWIYIPVEF